MFWTFPLSLRQPPHLCFTYPGDDITTDFSEIKPFIFPQTHPFLCPLTVLLSQLRDDVSDTSLCLRVSFICRHTCLLWFSYTHCYSSSGCSQRTPPLCRSLRCWDSQRFFPFYIFTGPSSKSQGFSYCLGGEGLQGLRFQDVTFLLPQTCPSHVSVLLPLAPIQPVPPLCSPSWNSPHHPAGPTPDSSLTFISVSSHAHSG